MVESRRSVRGKDIIPMRVRQIIDMDGTTHGPIGSRADCECDCINPGIDFQCGHACKQCHVGVVHWQPIYGGYFFRCDGCLREGISPERLE